MAAMNITDLKARLRLPVIAAPMFIISCPKMVIAQCKAGIVGSFPALNARPQAQLDEWLHEIREALATHDAANPDSPAAPFAVNQIVHRSNARLEGDMAIIEKHRVPIVITSLGAQAEVNDAVRNWGGMTFHDVIHRSYAEKALEKGADGLIAVCAGAGGHAGAQSPFALVEEIRAFFSGPLALSGAISTGRSILAAQATGADFAYIGSAFIATEEANATPAYKQAVVDGSAEDIVYSAFFTGVHGNYLKPSIRAAGLDPDDLPQKGTMMDFSALEKGTAKAWRDIWGAGQGIGAVHTIEPIAAVVDRLTDEYRAARQQLCG